MSENGKRKARMDGQSETLFLDRLAEIVAESPAPEEEIRRHLRELPAAAQLAAIFGLFALLREQAWNYFCRLPLEAALAEVTGNGPAALEPAQAHYVRETIDAFRESFPDRFDEIALCGFGHGVQVVIGMLARPDIWQPRPREDAAAGELVVHRDFADERHEGGASCPPRIKRDTRWVV